ncbi:cellulose biosynthesis cyclic di-GMP-binding regulatory protein BcsB [Paenibacillus sinopodophylli]|uniref:cellulose biosynthesis cyclic di-GMP-binding regulatory protein BcsB n=1 Tax=Paenibacillus sinopodophylli TaxID=1837342 RepID=UPI00110CFB31|nr:cellulose biosynthesis cyclic di-GMP-binding regulatory protein BcsB [Paenibacillus sinopodophylli]
MRWLVTSLLCLTLLFSQNGYAAAAAAILNPSSNHHYDVTLANTDSLLSGSSASKPFYFEIEDYWNIETVTLNLDYKMTPLAQDEYSSITLSVNGNAFHSFRPEATSEEKNHLTVSVPKALLIAGNNMLTVGGVVQTATPDQVCLPVDKQESWLQLYKTSNLSMTYAKEPIGGSIKGFYQQFIGLDTVSAGLNAIAVPVDSEPGELEAAVQALAGLAKANPLEDESIPMLEWNSDARLTKSMIVAVALYDHLPGEIKSQLADEDLSKQALIQLLSVDKQQILVVTSENAEMLVKAGRLLNNQELVLQLSSSRKLVGEQTNIATPAVSVNKNVTLTETGDRLTGISHQEKAYFIALPANRSIATASKISLDMRYANNLDFDRSLVTVLINDLPIGSKKLSAELANGDQLTLPIPKNMDITGNFSVTVAFDLELKNAGCITLQNQTPWAFVENSSVLQLNTLDQTALLFNNYPNPFLRDGAFNQVAVVLPEVRDRYTYLTISNLFHMLGRFAESNAGEVEFYEDDTEAAALANRNIIAIGTYQNNKVIRDQNEHLYFQYNEAGDAIQSNEKMSIDEDYGKRIGTLQLIDSPYTAGLGLMAVTGAGSDVYYLASKLLTSESTKWKVFGDGAVTDKDGNIYAFRFKKEAGGEQSTNMIEEVMERSDVLGFMVAIVLVLVVILLSLILLIRKYRMKRRESDET